MCIQTLKLCCAVGQWYICPERTGTSVPRVGIPPRKQSELGGWRSLRDGFDLPGGRPFVVFEGAEVLASLPLIEHAKESIQFIDKKPHSCQHREDAAQISKLSEGWPPFTQTIFSQIKAWRTRLDIYSNMRI
jgi:hypothetical protein